VLNVSIEQRKIPNEFKRAGVIPLYKKGCKLNMVNYKPISFNGVEKIVHDHD